MSLGRAFWKLTRWARAARFWVLLALVVLAWLGLGGEASAQSQINYSSQGEAYGGCMQNASDHDAYMASLGYNTVTVCPGPMGSGATRYYQPRENNSRWVGNIHVFPVDQACAARASSTRVLPGAQIARSGQTRCENGCVAAEFSNEDGTVEQRFDSYPGACIQTQQCDTTQAANGWFWNYTSGACQPPADECAANEIKDPHTGECSQGCPAGMVPNALGECTPEADNCPAGNVRAPSGECLPGDGQCAVGEARKPDGTCGRDSDGDGTADEFDPDTDSTSFSGGDSCDAPPTCNGDAIMCGIARINWRTECNTRKDTKVSGGSCDAVPVCTGRNCDALEYSQLVQQWRTSCALGALAGGGGDGDDDDGPQSCGPGMSDAQCEAGQNIGGEGDPSGAIVETEYGAGGFDTSGFGWASSCPSIPAVTVFDTTIDLQSKLGPMCQWFQLGGAFLMIATAITCITLLIRV